MKTQLLKTKFMKPILLTAFTCLAVQVLAQPIPEILYYDFNGTGTTVPNLASTPPVGTATATIVGAQTQGPGGVCNSNALIGTGTSSSTDYLNTGYATSLTGSWTLSFWSSNITPSSTLFYVVGDVTAGSFRCFTNGVAGADNWILRGSFTDVLIPGGATVAPHLNTWVYDQTAGFMYAYLDGALVNTVAQSPITISGTGPFKVGSYGSSTGLNTGGFMDDFRLYDRALSPAEILTLLAPGGSSTETVSACDSYFWPADGATYSSSGTYNTTVVGSSGCDSLLVLDLTINTEVTGPTVAMTACDSYDWNGSTYSASGLYADTLVAMSGCDSIVGLDLTINASPTMTESISACESYTWAMDGNTYTSSGIYTTYIAASPCDTIAMLDLTINTNTTSTITQTAIDSYTSPAGNTYTTSGTYTDVIANAAGCDSTITINLTVGYTGLSELKNGNLTLYPNPAQTSIRILGVENLTEINDVTITSISGNRVMTVATIQEEITISDLPSGIYFLNISHGQGTNTIRFVKQ